MPLSMMVFFSFYIYFSVKNNLFFVFFLFLLIDRYLENITVHNCEINCTLIPTFHPEIYNYYIIVPDNVKNMYFKTIPSENVTFFFDNPSYLLTSQEILEKKVSQIVTYKINEFDDITSMNKNEIEEILLSFYNLDEIDNNTINQYENMSFYEWMSEFVGDETTHNLIETVYQSMQIQIDAGDNIFDNNTINNNNNNNRNKLNEGRETLDSDGLLHEPWTPITVDINYDLHHYRIFVIRKAGLFDLEQFQKSMELNKNAYLNTRKCPDISLDAIVQSDIPQWWDNIRIWVVSLIIIVIMSIYIYYDRRSYYRLVERHKAINKQ